MKQPFIRALMIGGILLSVACVGPLQQWGEETTFRPKTTSFDPSTLRKEQVTVLNAVAGFGLEDVREFRIPFGEIARRLWAHLLDGLFKGVPVE